MVAAAAKPTIDLAKIQIKNEQAKACAFGSTLWCGCLADPNCGAKPDIPIDPTTPIPDPPPNFCK